MKKQTEEYLKTHEEEHKSHRAAWLRAAVLGANDGIVSTSSLMVGVATATNDHTAILTAGLAGLAAGALSMAVGEYVSVSSQRDSEKADIEIERRSIAANPDAELKELAAIYESRGISPKLALQVAKELHAGDAVAAHARDELGIDGEDLANPWQAAFASAGCFTLGALFPIIAALIWTGNFAAWGIVGFALIGLAIFGATGAFVGGGNRLWAAARVLLGGSAAMALTAGIGHLVGIAV